MTLAPAFTLGFLVGYPLYTLADSASLPLPRHPGCLLRGVTGLPCPYCGHTRAMRDLYNGEVGQSLLHHPLALVVVGFVAYLTWRGWRARRRAEALGLSWREFGVFAAITASSWVAKFVIGPGYY
jgi:hypothetical protein